MSTLPSPPRIRRPRPRQRGLSLVEVLIAAAVMTITVMGSLAAHVTSRSLLQESRDTDLANALLRNSMERVLEFPADDLCQGAAPYVPGQPMPIPDGVALQNQQIQFTTPGYTLGDPTPSVLDLRLTLTWRSSTGRNRTLFLDSATQ